MSMLRRFDEKVAIVTGAAGGIGRATALRLAQEGARLVLVDLHLQPLQEALSEVLAAGAVGASISVCDVSSEAQVEATATETLRRHGRMDVVVNNAGLMSFKPLEQFTGEDWNKILGVDLLGAFFFTKQAFLRMTGGGAIVNVASVHAVRTTPMVAPYAAAKAALLSLTRSTAIEGRARGIRCNAVLPGAVETPMLRTNPEVQAGVERIDASELAQPSDIAAAVAYLASGDATMVQGAGLIVDGGRLSEL
jgi:meso-butanediol dehydrogenase/(S,S)-butanediol dehydrogenase/diacetyl reductase